ncbi:MAG: transcriptional regulator [Gallionellales bacterium RIFCSPLOWO2_12_FULL_59_22]|nr:MAG: transcriptional regulator [Gallionellales bacterium RIFCSPLOWO2_02_FULL_59_110]OGT03782.1 MAG: transcriptional regulator [Gallionellales bacterium RIFCSPLOWO2_02_58_13]OGT13013.1 MAG: transcriptional regulator [Gallionellales bacterium RIFCSPLOWO2_12_FULL_59_22]
MARQATQEPGCAAISCQSCGLYQLCLPMGLDSADTALLDRYVKRKRTFKRGQVLYRSGDAFTYVYAIRSGSVKTYISTDDGRLQITGFHVPGELLGLNAIDEKRYSCEAVALETTSVCEISVACFEELARQIPSVHYQMLRMMSKEIRHNQELMLLLGKKNAEERLATYLLSLSRRFAMRNYSPTQFNLSMSRGDIGNYLGIAEETVSRIFSRFQEEGVISSERRHIILKDIKRLNAIAHEPSSAAPLALPLVQALHSR